jgi:hypothetical protein
MPAAGALLCLLLLRLVLHHRRHHSWQLLLLVVVLVRFDYFHHHVVPLTLQLASWAKHHWQQLQRSPTTAASLNTGTGAGRDVRLAHRLEALAWGPAASQILQDICHLERQPLQVVAVAIAGSRDHGREATQTHLHR